MSATNAFDGVRMAQTVVDAHSCSKKIKWKIICTDNKVEGMGFSMKTFLGFLFLAVLPCARAELKLPAVFSDNMVLQRNEPVKVWGWDAPGAVVSVEFSGQKHSSPVDAAGRWMVCLDPLEATKNSATMTVSSSDKSERRDIRNILVGDVWFCSGQSNMEIPVSSSLNAQKEIAAAECPEIRLLKVRKDVALVAKEDVVPEKPWSVCTPGSVADFSAVAYYFGREIQRESGIPIGLIQSSWGGTPIEPWIPVAAMESDPECANVLKPWREMEKGVPDYASHFDKYVEERKKELQELNRVLWQWMLRQKEAKEKGAAFNEPAPQPRQPPLPGHQNTPGGLFHAMVSPLAPFAIRGVIWYQGESNANQVESAELYGKQLPMLIKSWREAWSRPELPFYFVEIANYSAVQKEPREAGGWPVLRDMQLQTWKTVPHTGMAAAIDLGEADNIHPPNKQEVGRRLALHALKNEYGKDIPVSGPVLRAVRREGGKVMLDFEHVDGDLEARGGQPRGFALADTSGKWHWAEAEITGEGISLRSDKVSLPSAVTYGWASNPIGNLYSKQTTLPLVPFCERIP